MASTFFHTTMLVILIQLFIINVVRCEYWFHVDNATHSSHSNSGRSRRALFHIMPAEIKIQFEYSTGELVELYWIRQTQYLANEHLPILMSSGYSDPNVMNKIGEFVVYHDIRKCSSVVYFQKMNALFGYIGTSHFIKYLPFEYDEQTMSYPRVVRAPYVVDRINAPLHIVSSFLFPDSNENSVESFSDESARVPKRPFHSNPEDSDEGPNVKHQRTTRNVNEENYQEMITANASGIGNVRKRRDRTDLETYFLETLVYVTRGIAKMFQQSPEGNNAVEWIVRYCIIYFSAVEMIFKGASLFPMKFHMNIAKIVIETEEKKFHFISNGQVKIVDTVKKLREELKDFQYIHGPDSFDHVFVITSDKISDGSSVIPAATEYLTDLYDARSRDLFYLGVPITIINDRTDYADTVYEISRTFDMTIDPPTKGLEDFEQCTTIMQKKNSKCDKCLTWSETSKQQFRAFFRTNRDRCFLLNRPRSLRRPGPSIFVSPHKQCQCFGYDSYDMLSDNRPKGYIQSKQCDKPLRCVNLAEDGYHYENTLKPFDGSTCGNRKKVCWAGQCVPTQSNTCVLPNERAGYSQNLQQ